MSETTRWGIVGTGRMASRFASDLPTVNGAVAAGVVSRDGERGKGFAERHGVQGVFPNLQALVADPAVDVVYVATPHFRHLEDVKTCLEAGKPVLCERPFAMDPDAARPIIELAQQHGLFLMEGLFTRFVPAIVKVRELVSAKAVGDVRMVTGGGAYRPDDTYPGHVFDPEHGGGALLDSGIDLVAMALMILGAPNSVKSHGVISDDGIDTQDGVLLGFPNGRMASVYVSMEADQPPDMLVLGSKGLIRIEAPLYCPHRIVLEKDGYAPEAFDLPASGFGLSYEAEEVARCLREELTESPVMPLEETLRLVSVTNEIRLQIGLRFPME